MPKEKPSPPSGLFGAQPAQTKPPKTDYRFPSQEEAEKQSIYIRDLALPTAMFHAIPGHSVLHPEGYRRYLAQLQEDLGGQFNRLEQMLLEQVALAHFRIGALHGSAAAAKDAEEAKAYTAGAARLLGEMRRTIESLKTGRRKGKTADPGKRQAKKAA